MDNRFTVEANAELRLVEPQRERFYTAQLRSIGNFALEGAGADLGAGSDARQRYLDVSGPGPSSVTSLTWRSLHIPDAVHFAVLPPQQAERHYFGTLRCAGKASRQLRLEGVSLHPTGSYHGQLLVGYNQTAHLGTMVSNSTSLFVTTMRQNGLRHAKDPYHAYGPMDMDAHHRLGNALLSFWQTVNSPLDMTVEQFKTVGAYGLADLILKRQVEQAQRGEKGGYDKLLPYEDEHGNVIGFAGKDNATSSVTVMARHTTNYPGSIDYINIPVSSGPESADEPDALVTHYAISRHGVALRVCLLPAALVAESNINDLVTKIRHHRRPLQLLDDVATETIIRNLHAELGQRISGTHQS